MNPEISIVGTEINPKRVRMKFLTEENRRPVELNTEETIRSAKTTQMKVVRLIKLIVQIGNSIVSVQLDGIQNHLKSVLMGTDHINSNIHMIYPTKMKHVTNNSTLVEGISVGDRNKPVKITNKKDPYGLPTQCTEMVLKLQKQFSDYPLEPVSAKICDGRIVRAASFIIISP